MVLVVEFFAIVILFISLLYCAKYIMLVAAKTNADNVYFLVNENLKKHYNEINALFSQFPVLSVENRDLVDNTKILIDKASNFSVKKDSNERIIGYANAILSNTEMFLNSLGENGLTNINMQQYNQSLTNFNNIKDKYNTSAEKLKHYVDVFPTSFFARLKQIYTFDFIN